MTFTEWYKENNDPNNILAPSMDSQLAMNMLIEYLSDEDFSIDYPCSNGQANTEMVVYILKKYSRKFRKEIKEELNHESKCES